MSRCCGGVVGFCGSRSLPAEAVPLVRQVVRAVLGAHRQVAVGCSRGADAAALLSALPVVRERGPGHCPSLWVFAAFGQAGEGSWFGSAVASVLAAAALARSPGHGQAAPVVVSWLAGGPASVPLQRRLWARSQALVRFVARAGGAGSGLVAFVCGGWSSSVGSWASVREALLAGLPVVVFPVGCSLSVFPPSFVGVGAVRWVPAGRGVWASGFRAVVAGASGG